MKKITSKLWTLVLIVAMLFGVNTPVSATTRTATISYEEFLLLKSFI